MHQFDQDGIPVTSFTWDDMVECYDDSHKQAEKDVKDTLLEWAEGKKEEYEKETSREYDGCTWVLNLLIEKLESL